MLGISYFIFQKHIIYFLINIIILINIFLYQYNNINKYYFLKIINIIINKKKWLSR